MTSECSEKTLFTFEIIISTLTNNSKLHTTYVFKDSFIMIRNKEVNMWVHVVYQGNDSRSNLAGSEDIGQPNNLGL